MRERDNERDRARERESERGRERERESMEEEIEVLRDLTSLARTQVMTIASGIEKSMRRRK